LMNSDLIIDNEPSGIKRSEDTILATYDELMLHIITYEQSDGTSKLLLSEPTSFESPSRELPLSLFEPQIREQIDRYMDAYCSSQYFSKIIYGAEYDGKMRRHCRYRCEFQGQYNGKKKMIAEEQHDTRSKYNGCL
ncbi:10818_t:CDS:2, partial [Dentiscutata erythropus]